MARIDLPEPYAVRQARQSVRDSLMSHGEECILVHMYHANEVQDIQPRCPVCYDDVYKQGERYDCGRCYGTTFDGGVAQANRAWAIFTDANDEETFEKVGLWHPIRLSIQTEHLPDLWQRDYIIRVTRWSRDHRVEEIEGIYVLKQVTNESIRTGNMHSQTRYDTVGQRTDAQLIAEDMPIYKYPVIGQRFERFDATRSPTYYNAPPLLPTVTPWDQSLVNLEQKDIQTDNQITGLHLNDLDTASLISLLENRIHILELLEANENTGGGTPSGDIDGGNAGGN